MSHASKSACRSFRIASLLRKHRDHEAAAAIYELLDLADRSLGKPPPRVNRRGEVKVCGLVSVGQTVRRGKIPPDGKSRQSIEALVKSHRAECVGTQRRVF